MIELHYEPADIGRGLSIVILDPMSAAEDLRFRQLSADHFDLPARAVAAAAATRKTEDPILLLLPGEGPSELALLPARADAPPLEVGARLAGALARSTATEIHLDARPIGFEVADHALWAGQLIGGLMQARHSHGGQKADVPEAQPLKLHLHGVAAADRPAIERQRILASNVCRARDLILDPPNLLTPSHFAERCRELQSAGVSVEILAEPELRQLGMGGLLAIAQGSREAPRVVVMRWQPAGCAADPLVLIGKGVTFDSGGLALKQKADMHEMKHDMAGAAAVVGALRAIAEQRLDRHVVGIVGLVENMLGGAAVKPGDVVRMMSGLTVEIQNPDAEGRIVLADLMHYAATRLQPARMIDIATLTGAVQTALGPEIGGLFSNDDALADRLLAAGERTGDLLWRLPLHAAYDRHIEGQVSDLLNMGKPKMAGVIYAALFLQRFCGGIPWAHIDAGGAAWLRDVTLLHPQGTTGYGVRLLEEIAVS